MRVVAIPIVARQIMDVKKLALPTVDEVGIAVWPPGKTWRETGS